MSFNIGWTAGVLAMLLVSIMLDWDAPSKSQVGYTKQELTQMQEECEKDLPRTTGCSIVVYYLPQAELEDRE